MAEGAGRSPAAVLALLAALTVLAAAARLAGSERLLPHAPEPDAYLVLQGEMIRDGSPPEARATRTWAKYPHLLPRAFALLPGTEPPGAAANADSLEAHLEAAAAPYVTGRRVCAALSVLLVPLTFLLARRFLGPWASLLAAALVATSLLHLAYSHQARPHGPLASFTTATVLGAMALVRARGHLGTWLLVGLLAALAVGCLHNGFAVAPPIALAAWLARRRDGPAPAGAWLGPWLALVLVALSVAAFYPFLLRPGADGLALAGSGVAQAGHEWHLSWMNGGGLTRLLRVFRDHDPLLGVLLVPGAALLLLRLPRARTMPAGFRADLDVALAFAVPFLLVFGLFEKSFERFFLPLFPFFACVAAAGVAALVGRAPARARTAVAAAAALVALGPPTAVAWRYTSLHAAPDTYELAAAWVEANASIHDDRLLVDPQVVLPIAYRAPLWRPEIGVERMSEPAWLTWMRERPARRGGRGVHDVRYLLAPRMAAADADDPGYHAMAMQKQRNEVAKLGGTLAFLRAPLQAGRPTLLGRLLPDGSTRALHVSARGDGSLDGTEVGYEKERLWRRVFETERWGPAIDVFRVPPRDAD